MRIIKNIYILISIMAGALLFLANAFAGVSVSPDRHIISLAQGEKGSVVYHIHNSGDEDINMDVEPESWAGVKNPFKWLSLESDDIYVKKGESTPLVVNVKVPEDIAGEQVAMIFLCYKENTASQLNIRNGVPLYLIVEGTEKYSLEIDKVNISYGRKGDFNDLNFAVEIKNTGNVHIVPDVQVIVKNENNKVLNTSSLVKPGIVLRETNHTFNLAWREPRLRDDIYTAVITLYYEDKIPEARKEITFQFIEEGPEKIKLLEAGE
jgi:hypothetical protein